MQTSKEGVEQRMKKYILRIEDEPCNYEDGLKYYKCADVSYWQLSESLLAKLPELEPSLQYAHKRGMNEIWSALKWLWKHGTIDVNWSAEKILEEYQKLKDAIKVGDELEQITNSGNPTGVSCIVTNIGDDKFNGITEDGITVVCTSQIYRWWRKTGRTFPQIKEVLKAMQKGDRIMTYREAIKMQEAIKAGLKETGKDHPYRDALIPLMKESCDMAIKALETRDRQAIIAGSYLLEGEDNNVPSSDAISRKAAIDLVREVCDAIMSGCNSHYDSEVGDEVYDDILEVDAILKCNKEIRKALRDMPSAQPEPHWIPCSEKLPDKEGMYIVTDDAGGMATVSTDEFSHYEDNEPFWMFSQNVTAWMQMPEPYKEGEQDE